MFKKLLAISVTAATITSSSFALADQPSFNYVDLGYIDQEDADGFELQGSAEINDTWFWQAEYADAILEHYSASIGARTALSENTSFYGLIGVVRAEISISGTLGEVLEEVLNELGGEGVVTAEIISSDSSDTGYSLETGVRGFVSDSVELQGGIRYIDIFDDTDTTAFVGAVFEINEKFAITADATLDSDAAYGVGVRYRF